MLAIDTNLVVRFLVGDDPAQAAKSRTIIGEVATFVSSTVLLETAWVLKRGYGFPRSAVAAALKRLGGLPDVNLEEPETVAQALGWTSEALDFADALHLAKAQSCEAFVTFDRKFVKAARERSPIEVRLL